jgi:opacity protein-like surface antigen
MRRLILGTIGLLLFSTAGWAQEYGTPKAEVFGGFSISSVGIPSVDPTTLLPTTLRESFWGWQASLNGNLSRHLSIVGDFGGQYKTIDTGALLGGTASGIGVGMSNYQYLFGPQYNMRMDKINPFVHVMFGASRASAAVTVTDPITGLTSTTAVSSTGLGLGIGGGLDVNVSHKLALRVPQFDWTPMHNGGVWSKNVVRIGIGLVFKAGEK